MWQVASGKQSDHWQFHWPLTCTSACYCLPLPFSSSLSLLSVFATVFVLSFFVTGIAFNELQRKLLQVLQGSASSARSTRKFIDCLLGDDNNVNDDDSNDDGVENATGNASATGNNLGMSTAIESRLYIKCIFLYTTSAEDVPY